MKKLTALILMSLIGVSVWGQNYADKTKAENVTGEWIFSNMGLHRNVPLNLQMSNTIRVDGVNKWIWRRLKNTLDLRLYSYGINADMLTFQYNTGNVGIGTTEPAEALDVSGSIKTSGTSLAADSESVVISKYGLIANRSVLHITNNNAGGSINFDIDGTNEKMRLTNAGYLGIGTPDPKEKLDVIGNVKVQQNSSSKAVGVTGLKLFNNYTSAFGADNSIVFGFNKTATSAIQGSYRHWNSTNGGGGDLRFYTKNPHVEADLSMKMMIAGDGDVGIGTTDPDAKLDVAGNIKAQEIEVTLASIDNMQLNGTLAANQITVTTNGQTADFVFEEDYQLRDLQEVETFIQTNKHLPDIPSAAAMEENGVNLAEMNKLLLQKVEELTLYTIEQEEKLRVKDEEVLEVKAEVREVKSELAEIKELLLKR